MIKAKSSSAGRKREELRRRFLPGNVRLLFVGESPPASGRFFYQADSGLYRAIRDAFQSVDPSITDAGFLSIFQARGYYLIDLCAEPVDNLDPKSRRSACRGSEARLSVAIAELRPVGIATVVRSIEDNVRRAAASAGWHGTFLHLPYPGRWSRFRNQFVEILVTEIRRPAPHSWFTGRGGLEAVVPSEC